MAAPTLAQPNETREYQDGKRGTVLLPQGDKSFADAVVDRSAGTDTIEDSACDQQAILGPPDFSRSVKIEGMTLSISEDGETWIDLGDISGERAEDDLAGLSGFRVVGHTDSTGDGTYTLPFHEIAP